MSDSFMTVVLILITSVVLFVVPLATVSARSDISARQTVQAAVTEFVDTVRETRNYKNGRL